MSVCRTDGPGGAAEGAGAPEGDAGGEDEEVRGQEAGGQEAGGQEAGGEGRDEGGGAQGRGRAAAAREDAGLGGHQAVPQHPAEHRAARGRGRPAEVGYTYMSTSNDSYLIDIIYLGAL